MTKSQMTSAIQAKIKEVEKLISKAQAIVIVPQLPLLMPQNKIIIRHLFYLYHFLK